MKSHECSGCPHWKWHPRDKRQFIPGYHKCDEPDFCERFHKKKIQRDAHGYITGACLNDIRDSLPVGFFTDLDNHPYRIIFTPDELERFLFGALPYVLSTYYRSIKEEEK